MCNSACCTTPERRRFSAASRFGITEESVKENQVQNAEYKLSVSLSEARENVGLDVEASLSLA
ncbi:hypothetical protein PI124_g14715 [Phytophthora idaei]|nr:hypothetical protein PI125_g22012 [Phytophthora idaei]KAG3074370.1 hypothetical protein PI125_g22013 [Phytophthora idaei]KAG3130889.1 hypothetical protein PI126_g20295 [Phytophthora idaei]KAG3130890.1 hypothetical protein PI126_g20296 [Phytophthora idaei]KAG3240381.1 hypothetical protein PI124_g14716 [Phytophthora idaei]